MQPSFQFLSAAISEACLMITYVGIGLFFANFLMGAFSGMAGARVTMRAKTACMRAALNQDCEYYDVKSTPGEENKVLKFKSSYMW